MSQRANGGIGSAKAAGFATTATNPERKEPADKETRMSDSRAIRIEFQDSGMKLSGTPQALSDLVSLVQEALRKGVAASTTTQGGEILIRRLPEDA